MNKRTVTQIKQMRNQMNKYYEEILSSDAGKRVLGGIFYQCGLTSAQPMGEFKQGRRSVAAMIANTVREVNPYGVAECIKAHDEFMKEYADDERRNDAEPYEFTE